MRLLFFALLLTASAARAQSDEGAIPYSDDAEQDERNRRELPKSSDASPNIREETEVESLERGESLAAIDDPSIGLSLELIAGVLLLDSSRGATFEPKGMAGLRFTWEWSRTVFSDELLRELFFVDVAWSHAASSEGTNEINATSNYHYFSFAPAFAFPFGTKSPVSVYAQLGVGLSFNPSVVVINTASTPLVGNKFLFQYGGGLRFRPLIVSWNRKSNLNSDFDGAKDGLRLSFRLELTRFRRSYIDDTFVGGSLGVTF
ncbi:MAG: hypothetical protein H6Q89_5272 [Myxococcaceae bacterium]|nr:hypothetical protein [Myxococcaceae bacterium]